jgi:hypothetical protein
VRSSDVGVMQQALCGCLSIVSICFQTFPGKYCTWNTQRVPDSVRTRQTPQFFLVFKYQSMRAAGYLPAAACLWQPDLAYG